MIWFSLRPHLDETGEWEQKKMCIFIAQVSINYNSIDCDLVKLILQGQKLPVSVKNQTWDSSKNGLKCSGRFYAT
jgi:hypothetical protein